MTASGSDRLFATEQTEPGRSLLPATLVVALALLCSGGAALVNQIAWQGSLKRFLGGSETLSSMLVVLVFMAGLGIGSIVAARYATGLRNPLHAFATVEVMLAVVNTGVCLALRSELTPSIYGLQTLAASAGVPLSLLFGTTAGLMMLAPCLLMGATIPLASETCQRRLGFTNPKMLGPLFCINTVGSVVGAAVASFYCIPRLGFTLTLALGIALNVVAAAALVALALGRTVAGQTPAGEGDGAADDRRANGRRGVRPRRAEILAFGLGFCALGYEMTLFRLFALELWPLPYVFATVVAGFLLSWSRRSRGKLTAKYHCREGPGLVCAVSGPVACRLLFLVGARNWGASSPTRVSDHAFLLHGHRLQLCTVFLLWVSVLQAGFPSSDGVGP